MYSKDATSRTTTRVNEANHARKIMRSIERSKHCRFDQQAPLSTECQHLKMPRQRLEYVSRNCQPAGPYRLCSAIANALFRDARRMANRCADGGTPRLIAGRMAIVLLTAEQELGHHTKVVRLAREFSAWLSTFGDNDDLGSLEIKQIESLVETGQLAEAERLIHILHQKIWPPLVQLSLQLLTVRLRTVKANGPVIPLRRSDTNLYGDPLVRQLFINLIRAAAELACFKSVWSPSPMGGDFAF